MWAVRVLEYAVLKVPILIKIIFRFTAKKVYCDPIMFMTEAREGNHHIISNEAASKGDAHASADSIGIGG